MTEGYMPNPKTISNMALTLTVIFGLILCYFLAIPFLPAIVWSVTLGVLFTPLDAKIRRWTGSVSFSAALTVAIVALIRIGRPAPSSAGPRDDLDTLQRVGAVIEDRRMPILIAILTTIF